MQRITSNFTQKTLTNMSHDMARLQSMDSTENPLGYYDTPLIQIEMYSRMICYGANNPFPHSRSHLAFALIEIKSLLSRISLVEIVLGNPEIETSPLKSFRPDIKHIDKLGKLLDSPMISNNLPSLTEALRFVHSKDQQEIYEILKIKIGASKH